jgi:hypothetical protein
MISLRGLSTKSRKMVGCCKDFIAPEKYKKIQKNKKTTEFSGFFVLRDVKGI